MQIRNLCACAILAGSLTGTARANTPTVTLQDRQQAACYNDVQRLCPDAVPDVDAVTACMATKKKLVSPACGKFYDGQPAG